MRRFIGGLAAGILLSGSWSVLVTAQRSGPGAQKWVVSWAASAHGPYPSGNPSAQPDLQYAIPSAERGASNQTFRLMVRPDLWGPRVRLRFSNAFGTQPVSLDDVFVGLQGSGATVATGTNARVTFSGGKAGATIEPGTTIFSDAVQLRFVSPGALPLLAGRRLAVSFHVAGVSGPMTWHAKALTTSYVTPPESGSHGAGESDAAFPYSTASWFFLDAVDVMAPADTAVVVCFGDSITDGTGSTMNGDDRWPDVFARRLHAAHGQRVSVVNAGIGGNRIVGPASYGPQAPFAGGPSALTRLERDVLSLSGVTSVVWLEGINDVSSGETADAIIAGIREGVRRMRAHGPLTVVGATITSSLGSATAGGTAEADARRQTINTFIRTGGVFDAVADFDAATRDPQTGGLRAPFQPNSTIGGAGDRLHPNRAGYQAMGNAIDLAPFAPRAAR